MQKMLAVFSKNCVLVGDLDSYCLVCSILLTVDELEHIRSSKHKSKLKQTVYFEKYKDNFIKKVNGVYFCEVCNKTFATAAKVGIHVTEETHIKGRRRQLTRLGTFIIFQKDTLIEEKAWNGLIEDTCVICNADFDDHSTHISEHSHALNVVRSTVTIDDDNNIYRKVDEGVQCLTCNKVVSNTEISKHLDSEQHKAARVSLGCIRNVADNNNIDQRNEKKKEQTKENEASGDDTKVTSSSSSAHCRPLLNKGPSQEAPTIPVLANPHPSAASHFPQVDGPSKVTSNKNVDTNVLTENSSVTERKAIKKLTVSEELETYANKHGLFVTQDNFHLNCQICSAVVPGTVSHVKDHIAGKKHIDNMKRCADNEQNLMNIEKVLPKKYFRQTLIVNYRLERYVIINDSFCVEFNNFFFLLDVGRIICQLCGIEVAWENRAMHLTSPSHAIKLQNALVISSLKEEFVRQVNSRYHCGFCGVFQKDYGHMLDHLSTPVHKHERDTRKIIFERIKDERVLYHNTVEYFSF